MPPEKEGRSSFEPCLASPSFCACLAACSDDHGAAVVVAWIDRPNETTLGILAAVSRDDGATWGAPQQVSTTGDVVADPTLARDRRGNIYLGFLSPPTALPSGQEDVYKPWLLVDAADGLLAMWTEAPGVAYGEFDRQVMDPREPPDVVRVAHSADQGATVDRTLALRGGIPGDLYLLPQLARGPSGALALTYYTGTQLGPATFNSALSTDGGRTFDQTPWFGAGTFQPQRLGTDFLGDYSGLVVTGSTLYAAFGDNTGRFAQIVFAKRTLP
jgi:hypothetical protein